MCNCTQCKTSYPQMPLTIAKIENAQTGSTPDGRTAEKPYKMADSRGLLLLVASSGAKLWRMKYRFVGVEKTLAFGAYPEVSLPKARELVDAAKKLLAQGIDPSTVRREEKAKERSERLAAMDSSTVQVAVALDGTVRIWKGRAMVGLVPDEARAVRDLLTKISE